MKELLHLILFIFLAWLLYKLVGNIGNYDGMSAEDWADKYYAENSARVGAENTYSNLINCIEYESDYYYSDDFDELRDRLDNIQYCI